MPTVNSLPVERPLRTAINNSGYADYSIIVPSIATDISDVVSSLGLSAKGSGYTSNPTVSFVGGGGSGATAAAITGYPIATVVTTNPGVFTSVPTITASVGTGATFVAHMTSSSLNCTVGASGSGYAVNDTLTLTGGTFTTAIQVQVNVVNGSGGVTGFSVLNHDTADYTVVPANSVASTGGTGTGATFNMAWEITHVAVTAGGNDYTPSTNSFATQVVASGGGMSSAPTLIPTFSSPGRVSFVSITNGGEGYTSVPSAVISGGGGTGAAALATIGGADAPVNVSLAFNNELTLDTYNVDALASQPAVCYATNKTTQGVDIVVKPLDGQTLVAGTLDVCINFTK